MLIYQEINGVPSWFQEDSEPLRAIQAAIESTVEKDAFVHQLKCVNPYFEDIWTGIKTFELRFNDRNYKAGSWLYQREYFPAVDSQPERYGDRWMLCKVLYLLDRDSFPDGLRAGYICMAIDVKYRSEAKTEQC